MRALMEFVSWFVVVSALALAIVYVALLLPVLVAWVFVWSVGMR